MARAWTWPRAGARDPRAGRRMLGGNRVQEKPVTARAAADAVESLPDAQRAPDQASAAAPGIEGGPEKRRVLRDG